MRNYGDDHWGSDPLQRTISQMTNIVNGGTKPASYLGDLIHDGSYLAKREDKKAPFYWIVRECGTNIASDADSARMIVDTFCDTLAVYKFDGEFLNPINGVYNEY